MKRILLVGHGRSGKDTAGEYLSQTTALRFAGTTSLYLKKYVAARLGVSEERAYRERHQNRETWFRIGNEIREGDATLLVREALQNGEITGGIRDMAEIVAVRLQGLVDIIVWIENKRVLEDPTVTFSQRECDLVIPNNWTLCEFWDRLTRFAKFAGLPQVRFDKLES